MMKKMWTLLFLTINFVLLVVFTKRTHSAAAGVNRARLNEGTEERSRHSNLQRRNPRQSMNHTTLYACEGETLNLTCPQGYWIKILRANYGRFTLNKCNDREMHYADTQCKSPRTAIIMEERCNKHQSCQVPAIDDIFGDKCPETYKYLEAVFVCLTHTTSTSTTSTTTTSTTTTTASTTTVTEQVTNGFEDGAPNVAPRFTEKPGQQSTYSTSNGQGSVELNEILYPTKWDAKDHTAQPVYCQSIKARGIEWPLTTAGSPVNRQCPNNNKKHATWTCSPNGEWVNKPSLLFCTSILFESQEAIAEKINSADEALTLMSNVKFYISEDQLYGGDAISVSKTVEKISSKFDEILSTSIPVEKRFSYAKQFNEILADLVGDLFQEQRKEAFDDLSFGFQADIADRVLNVMEKSALLLAKYSTQSQNIYYKNSPTAVFTEIGIVQVQDYVKFPTKSLVDPKEDSIQIPRAAFDNVTTDLGFAKVVFTSYNNLADYMKPEIVDGTERKIVSKILSATMANGQPVLRLRNPVLITFATEKNENLSNPSCVFWYSGSNHHQHWSNEGCRVNLHNDTHTICACNHMTSFAVLMDVRGVYITSAHYLALSLVTYVGCIISIVALTLSILAFCIFRGVQGDRATIHKNLCFCLLVAELVFVFGIAQVHDRIACSAIAAVLHYFFLAAFAWMLLEGFQLYALLVEVFEAEQSRRKYFYLFAYGMPLVIVGISLGVDHTSYGTRRHCWLNTDNYFVFSFVGPVVAVLVTNVIFLTMAFIIMCRHRGSWSTKHKHSPTKSTVENFASWLKAAVVLVFLLGLTWAFGLFYVSEETLVVAYIFTVLNSLQGVFIFLFHVVFNEKMRKEWRKWLRRNDWLPSWVRDPALAYEPTGYGVGPCIPANSNSSSNGGIRSGGTSPVNTDSTNSGNSSSSYLQKLFRPLTGKRNSNRPLLGRSSSSNSGSSNGKHVYEYGYGRHHRDSLGGPANGVGVKSPRYIGELRPVPKFPPPLPPLGFSFDDDPELSTFDCSVVDSQYVNDDFGDSLVAVTAAIGYPNSMTCTDLGNMQISPVLLVGSAELDSGYSGSESCRPNVNDNNIDKQPKSDKENFAKKKLSSDASAIGNSRRSSSLDERRPSTLSGVSTSPDSMVYCKSSPSLQKPSGDFRRLLSKDCETQTDEDLRLLPLTSIPADLNYEIPLSSIRAVVTCGRNGRPSTVLLTSPIRGCHGNNNSLSSSTSKIAAPQRVRSSYQK